MRIQLKFVSVAVAAFALGVGAAHLPGPASAAAAPLTPASYDLAAMGVDAFPPASAGTPFLRSKTLVVTDGATVAVQTGTVFKHIHNDANEIQVVLEGTGSEWLGDAQVPLKPGTLVVIPKGTIHGGLIETSGHFKFVSVKTPPQDPADVHPVK
jgi:mannose-6-phosphate isomerase-like protein (cupin superfamily)